MGKSDKTYKLSLGDLAILVKIKLFNHDASAGFHVPCQSVSQASSSRPGQHSRADAQLLFIEILLQLFCNASEISNGNLSGLVVIKEAEGSSDFVEGISGENSLGHWRRLQHERSA